MCNTGCEDVRLGQKAADNNRFVLDGWTGCGEGKTMTLSSASGARQITTNDDLMALRNKLKESKGTNQ